MKDKKETLNTIAVGDINPPITLEHRNIITNVVTDGRATWDMYTRSSRS